MNNPGQYVNQGISTNFVEKPVNKPEKKIVKYMEFLEDITTCTNNSHGKISGRYLLKNAPQDKVI